MKKYCTVPQPCIELDVRSSYNNFLVSKILRIYDSGKSNSWMVLHMNRHKICYSMLKFALVDGIAPFHNIADWCSWTRENGKISRMHISHEIT